MEDPYEFPVFFECVSVDGDQKKKIENYFKIRRRSGGGECGPVTNISDKVYSIAFKDRDAQQRVLQRSEHVLESAGGPVKLMVRSSPTSRRKSLSPTQNFSLTQSQPSSLTPSSLTSGEEHGLNFDNYLLRYLKECPKVNQALEKELASVSCSAQLFPEDGRVIVRCLPPPDAVHDNTDWKVQAATIFDGYMCHYEVEPNKVKALLQTYGSAQVTYDVKVYSEVGMAVVVGRCPQVEAMLTAVEDLHIKQGLRSSKKQTSIRRLGKAKLCLLWKEIENSLRRDFPDLKVTQGEVGQIILEGSTEEVVKAGHLISNEEKLVLQRTVSAVSPHFLAFLRKAFGEPTRLGDFLDVGEQVEIELRDAELCIYTFSANKLDDTERKLHEKFKEDTYYIPCSPIVPSELQEKLKSKTIEINREQYRAQVVFSSDNKVCLLGHTKEFEELTNVVEQFILDQSCTEGQVILPFPELVQELPELLQLHKLDCSGVTIRPLATSSRPMVLLEGPMLKVTEVRNWLGPFLDSLVQDRVTIDMPGAGRYFESPSGRENIFSVAYSQKCLLKLQEQPFTSRQGWASCTLATYSLPGGLKVLVSQGDITKQNADALVNAANERLEHGGGVAAALSKAGGPMVQKESSLLVKQTGKIATGEVVVTTGGNLKCKKLLHAVGPIGGKSGGKERALLEKTVLSALNLSEKMEFESIAMPCISSGLFGVPVTVCSEAIATAIKEFSSQEGRSLSRIMLIDNREDVVRTMQEACDRILQGIICRTNESGREFQRAQDAAGGATAGFPEDVHFEIIQGTIETQQVDYLVCPMAGHDPLSTRIGHILSAAVGPQLTAKFYQAAGGATLPGDTVLVEDLPGLQSKGVIFLNLLPWDKNQQGSAIKALRQGIQKVLASCGIRGCRSVALPMLGCGAVLRFPHSVASRVVLEEIKEFERNRLSKTAFLVRTVIHPSDKDSSKAFQSAQEQLHLRGFTNDANPNQASFYRHVSVSNDEVTAMLGGVKLQMVNGDIIHETTDVIVNTTDFSNNQSGVSKAILTAAGSTIQAEFARVGTPADRYHTTGPGLLGCKEIIHASFMGSPEVIRKNCKKILKQCESKGYCSAAFPAINTGAAGVDFVKAFKAMLDGMTSAITDLKPKSLSLIRVVILEQIVFQAFRSELENRFGLTAARHLTLKEKAKQLLMKCQIKMPSFSTTSGPQDKPFLSCKPPPAVFSVITCGGPDTIRTIKRDLEGFLQKQLIERDVDVHDFSRLEPMELEAVLAKVKGLAISVEVRRSQGSEGLGGNRPGNAANAREGAGSSRGVYVLKGLKEDVLSVTELVHKAIQKALCKDLQVKEEAMLALNVQWSLQDIEGTWRELSVHDNYLLEEANMKKQVSADITAPDSRMVKVNLRAREATDWLTGITYKVKRSKTEINLEFPENWEPMEEELFKKVKLQPTSTEYNTVAQGFLQTAKYNICKIERVQNSYLWHAYSVCKQRISAKNGPAELGEKTLYHGTSAQSCDCIERDKFDRSYAGTHAAAYGRGVYFAVNANYSASGFSPPDALGLKRMYVARVLTGRYTVGSSSMKAPPPRGSDKTDCFDSVVNNLQTPSMFVIFHDDQAYPEYLITFK